MTPVWVIGGGPAGLMAAVRVASVGLPVIIVDHKPSLARKFLMAGKSGLNLTMDEPRDVFLDRYFEGASWLRPILSEFGPEQVKVFAVELEQELFTGSSGRVFPVSMKASPLLRVWLRRLDALGVKTELGWRWTGWNGDKLSFDTPEGDREVEASATILALGGGSWARLGSDGKWASILASDGVDVAPFEPSNVAIEVPWSRYMAPFWGTAVKSISLRAGQFMSRGEVVITKTGLEGGGVYSVSPGLRGEAELEVDLLPDMNREDIISRLKGAKPSDSMANKLRKSLRVPKVKQALLQEFARPLPTQPEALAETLKALPITGTALGPLDGAISTAGGVRQSSVDEKLMLRTRAGTFVAGEMLNWDAPTGGYLITACLATGSWAGQAAADWVKASHT